MKRMLRLLLAAVLGVIAGSAVNMALIMLSGRVVAPPVGADVTTMEGLKAALPLFEPRHFVMPFVAHALGTFVGSFMAALVAPARSRTPAYVVGAFFLLGGIANVLMLPAPPWFNAVDLLLAYGPPAWLAQRLASRLRPAGTAA